MRRHEWLGGLFTLPVMRFPSLRLAEPRCFLLFYLPVELGDVVTGNNEHVYICDIHEYNL